MKKSLYEATTPAEPYSSSTSLASPGAYLREGRIKFGFTLEKIASDLRLTKQRVIDMENDHFLNTIPFTFIKGYLRSYARLVEVDSDKVMAAFEQLGLQPLTSDTLLPPNPIKRDRHRINYYVRWSSYLIAAIMAVLLIFWLQSQPKPAFSVADAETETSNNPLAENSVAENSAVEETPAVETSHSSSETTLTAEPAIEKAKTTANPETSLGE